MTNLYVVGYDRNPEDAPHPLALSACGEAAHPNREIALHKALLEYVAARARKLFNHAPLEMIESVAPWLPRPLSRAPARQRRRSFAPGDARVALPLPPRDVRT